MISDQLPTAKRVLLIIGGGIAAYKSLYLIRLLKTAGIQVTGVLTAGGAEFITPLSVGGLTGKQCYTDLFDLNAEAEMGHIELSRSADLVVVAPATADLMAKCANGHADDLASTLLLATDKKTLFAPAMNVRMWHHPATQRNIHQLKEDGAIFVGPEDGEMACGEHGLGRMSEPQVILSKIIEAFSSETSVPLPCEPGVPGGLEGKHILVTAGPTQEPLDPVRYIANRSSGKQGYAIASACMMAGAKVTLVSGPTNLPDPNGIKTIRVETARQMQEACMAALPADCAVMCAAVADYRPEIETAHKIKKERGGLKSIPLTENPDILKEVSHLDNSLRPTLVIGFAAETDDVLSHAEAKRRRKGCDWIVANDVSVGTGIMGGDANQVIILSDDGQEKWPMAEKTQVAQKLAERIAVTLSNSDAD